ncbi:Dual specificity phosphatase, catalytic domain [Dillenia turbinata]|uniref:phosphatidylglycerophosphatase n=1 Tax=Dillenia turbinata TaxID=194707 RepID=A0AAN8W7T4_9MAGN
MHIEELKGVDEQEVGDETVDDCLTSFGSEGLGIENVSEMKRALIGAGARALFYPTLVYNLLRNKLQPEFRWWDPIDNFLLLGAVPFPSDVIRLKELGVGGVVTLNEPYETLVPTSLYHDYGIDHLVIPTRDYLFAPSLNDISQAVDFIHRNASLGRTTYVHCKAGRGRSTTIVICYLVQHKQMTPDFAYQYVKSIRPRVLLAAAQWQAVQQYYQLKVKDPGSSCCLTNLIMRAPCFALSPDIIPFDDGSVVIVTKSDLDGYNVNNESCAGGNEVWADLNVVYRVQVVGQAALARLSCLWLRCRTYRKLESGKLDRESNCSATADRLVSLSVDIHVY